MISQTSNVMSLMTPWVSLYQSLVSLVEVIKPNATFRQHDYQDEPSIGIYAGTQLLAIVTPTPDILDLFIFIPSSIKKPIEKTLPSLTSLQRLTWQHSTHEKEGTRVYFPVSDETSLEEALGWLRLVVSHLKS